MCYILLVTAYQITTFCDFLLTLSRAAVIPTQSCSAIHGPLLESNILTYLLTPWSRVLLEKLTVSAARLEIPHIFGTRRFLTGLKRARHLSLF